MSRSLAALAALAAVLALTAAAPAADGKKITVRWHGQSFFEIVSSAGTRIVTDPHAIDAFGRKVVKADVITVSHFHTDHTQVGVVENFREAVTLTGLKDPKGDGKKIEWNAIDQKVKDVHFRTVGTFHDEVQGMKRGRNAVFIMEVDGLKFVHLGDLGHILTPAQVKAIGPVDVLLIPVGGVYTINGSEAKRVVEQLKPRRYILPMHHGTKEYSDLLTNEEFLDEQPKDIVKKYTGNQLVIEVDGKQNAALIAVLQATDRKE